MSQSVTIIIIEDDDGHALLIEKNLRRGGINNGMRRFKDGTSALSYFFPEEGGPPPSGVPVLVLLDLNLPDMAGVDILKRLKEDSHLKRVPVVVLTTTDDKVEIERCYALGANVYVTKPVAFDQFAAAILQLGLFFAIVQIPETD